MLRIESVSSTATRVVYELTGGITAGSLSQLKSLVRSALEAGKEVVLDFGGVSLVDQEGARLIAAGLGSGVRIVGLPPGLVEMLREMLQDESEEET